MASVEAEETVPPPLAKDEVLSTLAVWCDENLREQAIHLVIDAGDVFSPLSSAVQTSIQEEVKGNFDGFLEALQQEQRLVVEEEKQDALANEFVRCVVDVARIRALSEMFDPESGVAWIDLFGIRSVAARSIASLHNATGDTTDEWVFNIAWHFSDAILNSAAEEVESVEGDSDEPVDESDSEDEGEEDSSSSSKSCSLSESESGSDAEQPHKKQK